MQETVDHHISKEEIEDQEWKNTEITQRTLDRLLADPQISHLGAIAVGELGFSLSEKDRGEKPIDLTIGNLERILL